MSFTESTPIKERINYLRISIAIALPFTVLFSLINYFSGFLYLAAVEALTSLFILVPALTMSRQEKLIVLAEYMVLIYGLIVTTALIVFGGIVGSGTLWVFAFPFIAFLLKDQRIGWYMCLAWMVVMSVGLSQDESSAFFYNYPEEFKPQLILAMFFYSLIAASFNLARSRYEKLLIEQIKVAEDENEFKSQFLSNVSHEIRTPLNAIYNLADFAIVAKEEQVRNMQLMQLKSSTRHLLLLLNNVLDFAKLEKQEMSLELTVVNLREEFSNVVENLNALSLAKFIEVAINVHQAVPEYIIADQVKIHQILFNIIGNAIKFTPEHGHIQAQCEVVTQSDSTVILLFKISDNGIGMTESQQKIIFESFKQADVSTTRQFGGTGLGLAIVKQLVQLIDGKIWVESKPGSGSTFYIEASFDKPSKQAATTSSPAVQHEGMAFPQLQGLNVLVVEDDPINLYIAMEMLQQEGINAREAENGQIALDLLNQDIPVDEILMDISMPVMNGLEATRLIRESKKHSQLPIIGLSANINPQDLEKARTIGMNSTLSKPVIKDELMKALEKFAPDHLKSPNIKGS